MTEGESKKFQRAAQTDFGLRQDKLVRIIPFEQLPKNLNPEARMRFQTRGYDGKYSLLELLKYQMIILR